MRELDKVLDSNEKVLWEGRPKFLPYFFTGLIPILVIGLLWSFCPLIFLRLGGSSAEILIKTMHNFSSQWNLFFYFYTLVGFYLLIGVPIYKALYYRVLYYAITDKRVMIQGGIIGRDFKYVDFDKITNAEVNVNIWDKIFGRGSGSVMVFSANSLVLTSQGRPMLKYFRISNVENPYEVFKFLRTK